MAPVALQQAVANVSDDLDGHPAVQQSREKQRQWPQREPRAQLERVSPSASPNYARMCGVILGSPTPAGNRVTEVTLEIPFKTKEGGQVFTLELWDDAQPLASSLYEGLEVVALGRLRAQRDGQVVMRADNLQAAGRDTPGLPWPGFLPRDSPRPAPGAPLVAVAAPYSPNLVKLVGLLRPGPPRERNAKDYPIGRLTASLEVPFKTFTGSQTFPLEGYREVADALEGLAPGAEVAVQGRLRVSDDQRVVVVVDVVQVVDRTDPTLPVAGQRPRRAATDASSSAEAAPDVRAAAAGSGSRTTGRVADSQAAWDLHFNRALSLPDIAEQLGKKQQLVIELLTERAVKDPQACPLRWRSFAEDLYLSMDSGDVSHPHPSLLDLMALVEDFQCNQPDAPRTKDGSLKLRSILDYILGLKDGSDMPARMQALMGNKGYDAAFGAIRLALAANATEGRMWQYRTEFPEDVKAA